jgi:hypothetical protein
MGVKIVDHIDSLIRFHQASLRNTGHLLEPSVKYLIQATIHVLEKAKKAGITVEGRDVPSSNS